MKTKFNLPFVLLLMVFGLSAYLVPSSSPVKDAPKVSHSSWSKVLSKYVTAEGLVDYVSIKKDVNFKTYLELLSRAQPENTNWTKQEKMAFWINTYNAFTIKLINENWPVKSIKDIQDPWDQQLIVINGNKYSLNDVEHKILRKMGDPRIHFAIVCASYSCPVLLNAAYDGATLDAQLTEQAKAFVNDSKRNIIQADNLKISKLFSWFKSDFTVNRTLIEFLNKYASVKINSSAKVEYLDYDWSLNKK